MSIRKTKYNHKLQNNKEGMRKISSRLHLSKHHTFFLFINTSSGRRFIATEGYTNVCIFTVK